ncbi:anthranilate synthase component I family protein [Ascidiimonas sp. W6]|uniref:anthranilate synthase component I family protein n=1 Tax=Ascidiimonas meishanensis TaxID=3128903 RepID=UPI0030EEC0D1
MRISQKFQISNIPHFKKQLLQWAQQHDEVLWLDSNAHKQLYGSFDALLAIDALTSIVTDSIDGFDKLSEYRNTTNDWIFGYLAYDLKNDVEILYSKNFDGLAFPDLYFFQPKKIFILRGAELEVQYLRMVDDEIDSDFSEIKKMVPILKLTTGNKKPIKVKLRIHKDAYHAKVNTILQHIQRGDIYEANFCQEFYAEEAELHPLLSYWHLNEISTPPFATFLKLQQHFLVSASPERYLRKESSKVISQPIKGTSKRGSSVDEDELLKKQLVQDPKERSENIMITDLVRNDLSKTARKGSVKVEELCKVYAFQQVHQMISTVVSEVNTNIDPVNLIKTTFPMGSMTGAPKIAAMNIIENLEETKRGLYSGAVGYFSPEGDFDFNVIIRSILYNAIKKYVSFSVGSAITAGSVPEKEYEECLIKAKAMREVLE